MEKVVKQLQPLTPGQLGANQWSGIVAGNVTVALLATFAVGLRFSARRSHPNRYQADDWLVLAALAFGWATAVATIAAADNGLGQHLLAIFTANPSAVVRTGQAYLASEVLWAVTIPLVKISILLLYVRLFDSQRYFRVAAWALGIFTIIWSFVVVLVVCLQCQPIAAIWDKSVEGSCIDSGAFLVSTGVINMITDLVLLVLPLPVIWTIQKSKVERIALGGIYIVGTVTCAISIIRIAALVQTRNDLDSTWSQGLVSVWTTAELCLGIVAASLPTLKPLFGNLFMHQPTLDVRASSAASALPLRNSFDWSSIELGGQKNRMFRRSRDNLTEFPPVKNGVIEVRTTFETSYRPRGSDSSL